MKVKRSRNDLSFFLKLKTMKTTVAICKASGKTKSTPLLEMAHLITECFPNFRYLFTSEVAHHFTIENIHVIQINGKVVAFDCNGYSADTIEGCLEALVHKYKCHLIFCSFESPTDTEEAIKKIAKNNRYELMFPVDSSITNALTDLGILKKNN